MLDTAALQRMWPLLEPETPLYVPIFGSNYVEAVVDREGRYCSGYLDPYSSYTQYGYTLTILAHTDPDHIQGPYQVTTLERLLDTVKGIPDIHGLLVCGSAEPLDCGTVYACRSFDESLGLNH